MTNDAAERLHLWIRAGAPADIVDAALAAERKAGWAEGWADGIREKRAEHIEGPIRKATVERIRAAFAEGYFDDTPRPVLLRGIPEWVDAILDAEATGLDVEVPLNKFGRYWPPDDAEAAR